jgi:mono/diheme cytochrome c family protein
MSFRFGPRGAFAAVVLLGITSPVAAEADTFVKVVKPFLAVHCVKCHRADRQAGDVRLDDLTGDPGKDGGRWLAVREQIRDGLMPPAREPRPDAAQAREVVAWVTVRTGGQAARRPSQGNLIPHDLLFGKPAAAGEPPAGRVWRLSPEGYLGFVRDVSRKPIPGLVQPFTLIPERGIKDFAGLYTIDEPSTEILLRNAEAIVEVQTAHEIRDGRVQGKNDSVREFVALMDPALKPTRPQLEKAIQQQFKMAIGRTAAADEVERFLGLYEKCNKVSDSPGAVKTMLQAVLLRTDALFRSELGQGAADGGRRMLSPEEIAVAVSLALGDRREPQLMQAAQKGELRTRDQVAAHIHRLLTDPKVDRPRILRFFREYFDYGNATNVFKDRPKTFVHAPQQLVADTDRLVLHIVAADKDVFRQLLTTPTSFVNYAVGKNKQKGKDEAKPGVVLNPINNKGQQGVEAIYGLEKWPAEQPALLPPDTRLGILMQPSWLVAYSTNFENDPVRRGRWVRERLLGGTVPDLPIGVAAQVPDEPHRTFRDRLSVTREARCWKCHSKMDELGLPFENFDHFGRFRTTETVLDPEATAKNVDSKGKPLGPVTREVTLNTTGAITDSGDPRLDGPVKDPRELIRKLADSERVRQVFVRHAFRFFLGRNETLSDARTLQEADRAYVASGGSFKALVVSLLTSDSFLYRAAPNRAPSPASGASR